MTTSSNRGFSLSEIIIVLLMTAILSMYSITKISSLLKKQQQNGRLMLLRQAILYARHYAIIHHTEVILCPSADHLNCQQAEWSQGVLIKTNHHILVSLPALPYGHTLSLQAFPTNKELHFTDMGFLTTDNGRFSYTVNNGTTKRLWISKSGRVRISDNEETP